MNELYTSLVNVTTTEPKYYKTCEETTEQPKSDLEKIWEFVKFDYNKIYFESNSADIKEKNDNTMIFFHEIAFGMNNSFRNVFAGNTTPDLFESYQKISDLLDKNVPNRYLGLDSNITNIATLTIKPKHWYEQYYSYKDGSDTSNAILEIINRIDNDFLSSKFDEIDKVLKDVEYWRLTPELMMTFLRITHRASDHLPSWSLALEEVIQTLKRKNIEYKDMLIGLI